MSGVGAVRAKESHIAFEATWTGKCHLTSQGARAPTVKFLRIFNFSLNLEKT